MEPNTPNNSVTTTQEFGSQSALATTAAVCRSVCRNSPNAHKHLCQRLCRARSCPSTHAACSTPLASTRTWCCRCGFCIPWWCWEVGWALVVTCRVSGLSWPGRWLSCSIWRWCPPAEGHGREGWAGALGAALPRRGTCQPSKALTWNRTETTAPQISSPTMNCSPNMARIRFSQHREAKPFRRRIIHLPPFLLASS